MSLSISCRRLIYICAVILMTVGYGCTSHKSVIKPTPIVKQHVNMTVADLTPQGRLLLKEAEKWLGTPYKYGGTSRSEGVDCSGLVMSLYSDALSIKLPRNSAAQAEFCNAIERDKLEVGDLVFFAPRHTGRVNHVGMYIGDGDMIHASGSRGVMISSLCDDYFVRNFYGCGRVEQLTSQKTSSPKSGREEKEYAVKPQSGPTKYDEAFVRLRKSITDANKPSVKSDSTVLHPSRRVLEDAIDQRVDSICSSFFD